MSDIARRNNRNRRRGKTWEKDILDGSREEGFDTERTRDTGANDEGDLVIRHGGHYFVIEAKNAKLEPTPFLNEAEVEREHFIRHRNLPEDSVHKAVFVKRRGKGFLRGLALMEVEDYLRLITLSGKVS